MSNLLEKASIVLTPTAYSDGTLHSIKPLQTLGSELVTNGDFATDSDWTLESGWSISNGKLSATLSNSTNAYQAEVLETGKTYQITYEISNYSQGGVRFQFAGGGGTVSGTSNSSNGLFTEKLKATVNHTSIRFRSLTTGGGFTGSIDNVSVKEVIDADFDFSRPTTGSATGIGSRENSSGNIESVAANLPRIDYLGGTAHILLEPQSTNTATYSNDFTQGDIFNSSNNPSLTGAVLTSQQATSPDNTNNAWLLKDNNSGGSGVVAIRYFGANVTSNHFNTITIFVKKALSNDFIIIKSGGFDSGASGSTWFDINNGTLGNVSGSHTAKIEDYGSGYYRCSVTFKTITDVDGSVQLQLASSNGSDQVTKDGTNGVYIFGLQCEADASRNFATSYIPTSGSTVTRSADEANNSGSSDLINSTEGVLYAEIAALADDGTNRILGMSNGGDFNNSVLLRFSSVSNRIQAQVRLGGVYQCTLNYSVSDATEFNKIAFKYKQNDFSLYVNGIERATDTLGDVITGLDVLDIDVSANNVFYGKIKCVAVFKEALTDAQLTCLTT